MDLGHYVPHQARHTLATNLWRHGATLTHIRRYLGQVSDRMAEHYVHLTSSDLENVLQHVWVTGPGTAQPGELLAGDAVPLTRQQAQALAIDLSRRSTPAEGGFCTFQPVVDGGACPLEPGLPQLRQVRALRRRPALLAAQAPAVAATGRRRPGRRPRRPCQRPASRAQRYPHSRQQRPRTGNRVNAGTIAEPRTAAAQAARRRKTENALERIRRSIARLQREKAQVSVAVVARRADVSRTFLYDNTEARAMVTTAISAAGERRIQLLADQDDAREATWRERALNAEEALKAAHAEILTQRTHISGLLGQIRDLEAEWTQEAVQRITSENTTLKQRVRQLTTDNRALDERLKAARSNLRFQDRRVADLEAQIADPSTRVQWSSAGRSMEGGSVDEFLDVIVEGSVLDQFQVEVSRTLEDRVQPGLTGDDGEERDLYVVD